MTKVKKDKVPADGEEAAGGNEKSYQELIENVNAICAPLASRKLSKKLYKCVKKVFFSVQDLGSSAGSKRPTCVILIKPHQDYQEAYDECADEVSALPKPL
nr:PREDICTED: H/ACA ribonucleoprotein complex subunit 2 [Paralichthys olivaceus]